MLSCAVDYEHFVYPAYETPLVEAYDGLFEAAYILLHPFLRVPEELAWSATKQYPSDEQVARVGAKCSWAHVAAQTGLRACARLNQALLTSIGSLADHLCDHEARNALQRFLESEPIWMPGEGRFEPLLQTDMLNVFSAAGHDALIFVPEFPRQDPLQRLSIAGLRSGQLPFPVRGSLVAPDASFLFTVDWDSFFTLFYGRRHLLLAQARDAGLEGFFALPTTEHFWFNYSMGCATVTLSPEDWQTVS